MKTTRLAGTALAALVGLAAVPAFAMAHGSMSNPPSRLHGCAFAHKDNPACVDAFNANTQAIYDWMELNIGSAADRHEALIPDGQLCSAGRSKYAAFDVARLLGYLGTWSGVQRYKKATGDDPVAARSEALRAAWGGADTQLVTFTFDVTMRVGRVE